MCFCSPLIDRLYKNEQEQLLHDALFCEWIDNGTKNGGRKYINLDNINIKPLLNKEVISCINITYDNDTQQKAYNNSSFVNSNSNLFEVATKEIRKLYFDIDIANKYSTNPNDKQYLTNEDILNIAEAIQKLLKESCNITDTNNLEYLVFNKMTQECYNNINNQDINCIQIKSFHLIFPYLSIKYRDNLNIAKELNKNNDIIIALNNKQHIKKANHKILDESVYTKTQQLCLPFNTKPAQTEYFYPYANSSHITINDYEKYMITNTDNTTLITYGNDLIHIEAKRIRKLIFDNEEVKVQTKIIQVKQSDNLIDLLIQELPNSLYNSNMRWRLLIKYLIMNEYNTNEIVRFMEHSASKINQTFTTTEINNYIDRMKNEDGLTKYKCVMEYIAIDEKVLFLVSNIKKDLLTWFYEKTNTDLNNTELSGFIVKSELDNADIKNPKHFVEWKTYTIYYKTGLILDKYKKTYYNYIYDTTSTINDYNIKAKEALSMEQISKNIIELYKNNDENCYSPKSFVAVKAKWGSGKTKHIVNGLIQYEIDKEKASQTTYDSDDEYIDTPINNNIQEQNTQNTQEDSSIKILMITNSNNLNTENITKLRKAYPSLKIVSHLDKANFNHDTINILVCSLDSIKKAIYGDNRFHYNMIILDEYESIMSYMTENTNYKHAYTTAEEVYDRFSLLLKEADKIVALDADLSIQRLSIVSSITGLTPHYYLSNVNNFKDYKYKYHYKIDKFETILNDGLEANKKIAIMSSTKKSLETIKLILEVKYPHKKYLLINNSDYTQNNLDRIITKADFIKNIETEIKNIDVFLYSPTITIGVSIEAHYFNMLLCIPYDLNVPNARVFIQMIYRLRNLIDKVVHIFPHSQLYYKPLNSKEYEKQVSLIYEYNIRQLTNKKNSIIDKTYERLRSYNQVENKYSTKHFNEEFLMKLKEHELVIEFIYETCKNEFGIYSKEVNEIKIHELAKTKLISYDESIALKALELTTYENNLAQDKYHLTKIVPSRIFDVITDREYFNDTRENNTKHKANNKDELTKNFIENDIRITEALLNFRQTSYDTKTYFNHEPLTALALTNQENKELKLSKDNNELLNKQYLINILERLGANKYNNFYVEYDFNEWKNIVLTNKDYIIKDFGKHIASITSKKIKKLTKTDDDSIIKYFKDGLHTIDKLEIEKTRYKRKFDCLFCGGKEMKITKSDKKKKEIKSDWKKLNAYDKVSTKSYYKNKDGISKEKWIITISLKYNAYKYNWLNNTIKINNNWIHTKNIIQTDWSNEMVNMDCNDYSVKFVKINDSNKSNIYNLYINNILIKQVKVESNEKTTHDIDGVKTNHNKLYSNTILNTRRINIWDNEANKTNKLICSNSKYINMNDTYKNYDTIKPYFRQTCNVELQSVYGLLYCNVIAINQFNYDYDVIVNKLVSNIQLTTIITKKYYNSNKTFTSNEYNNMRMKLKLNENDYDKLNAKYINNTNGMNYNTHKKIAEKASIIKTDFMKELVENIINNAISVVCNEPLEVIEPTPTCIKLETSLYYNELVSNISNTIKYIFNKENQVEWGSIETYKTNENGEKVIDSYITKWKAIKPIGYVGVMKNGSMLNDLSNVVRGDKLILCYNFKEANGLLEVSFVVN